jgi:hypothetical protein
MLACVGPCAPSSYPLPVQWSTLMWVAATVTLVSVGPAGPAHSLIGTNTVPLKNRLDTLWWYLCASYWRTYCASSRYSL